MLSQARELLFLGQPWALLAACTSGSARSGFRPKPSLLRFLVPTHWKGVVAGGGVGGLLLAKALSKEPTIKVTVLEQASAFQRFGGPIQLASNALSVIRDVDAELFEES